MGSVEWTDAVGSRARLSNLMVGRAVTHDFLPKLEVLEIQSGSQSWRRKGRGRKGGEERGGGEGWKLLGVASRFKGKLKGLNLEKIESGAVGNGE